MRVARALAALTVAAVGSLTAQDVAVRLGGFRTTYADSLRGSATAVGAEAAWDRGPTATSLAGSFASFTSTSWAAQGSAAWARAFSAGARRTFGLSAEAAGYAFSGGTGAGTVAAGPFVSTTAGALAADASVTTGWVRRIDGTGARLTSATLRLRGGTARWGIEGWATASSAGSRRYADVATSLRLEADGVSLDLVGGRRQGDLGRLFWGQVRAASRIAGPVWFEAGAGRYPPDATGFLHGVFANAGLRIGLGGRARSVAASDVVRVGRGAGRASAASPSGVAVRFTVAHTTAVGVAGEWTEWATVPLEVDGRGRRVLRTRLAPGVYRFVLVSADGRLFVPAGVPTVPDDFGGVVGLLVVRE